MENVFQISDLTCEYIFQKPVLQIKTLLIPRGKLIFVVGASGIGKSTFIETLGFMNRTIAHSPGLSLKYSATSQSPSQELKSFWDLSNDELSNFRRENFSFIFQNTNLMPNFTAGENMMFSLLLQGKSILKSKERVLEVMRLLSLDEEIFDKRITALSGGQRQRLAFVRAITSEFKVLFGDEPTGNLDEKTADDLMVVLKHILETENKTGIIVSHDLDLALQFADVIIPITQRELDAHGVIGEIHEKNIISRKGTHWLVGDGVCNDPKNYINTFLKRQLTSV
ncbi:MAG TPA: ABC transporter ATP-binding protein [Cryomorphaceae bacterium]|nr:ABC transporter ATP-binding protein [Cryomorphaceae bacterium]